MINKPFFRKHFFITVGVFATLLLIGLTSSFVVTRADRERIFNFQDTFYAKAVELQNGDRVDFLRRMNDAEDANFPFVLDLVDHKGTSFLTGQPRWTNQEFEKIEFPVEPGQRATRIHADGQPSRIIMLHGQPESFLVVSFKPQSFHHHDLRGVMFLFMLISTLIASALSVFILFNAFRVKALVAQEVLSELQRGNLKARFPITKLDEVGHLMQSFNKMAEEIERLVNRLQDNDKARVSLLQELAHDLRTPVASLKSLLETLQGQSPQLKPEVEKEIRDLAVKEVEFFERLVEDLLFLGQVMEPKYRRRSADVDIAELFEEQVRIVSQNSNGIEGKVHPEQLREATSFVLGDEQLLTRLVRNGLENAFSFARSAVVIDLISIAAGQILIRIEDDGPGLSEDSIRSFGIKRGTRLIGSQNDGRLSVGLGSVIMRTIAEFHQGGVSIQNRFDGDGHCIGACLEITLPLSGGSSPS